MEMKISIGGVAAIVFVALIAGAILYWGGGFLGDAFPESDAGNVKSVGVVLLVIGVVSVVLMIAVAIYDAVRN